MLPDPLRQPVLTVKEAGALWGLGRSKSYDEARRYLATDGAEGLPAGRFGRTIRCPTAAVLRQLGLLQNETAGPEEPAAVVPLNAAARKRGGRGSP
jgi:hypothetical protein